jgi:ribosome-binding protein aMBF1 (putative translation factor)
VSQTRRKKHPARRSPTKRKKRVGARLKHEGEIFRQIGQLVRSAREEADLTQEVAAAAAGIDYKRWQELEGGRVNPTARTLMRVADALGTDIWALLRRPTRRK